MKNNQPALIGELLARDSRNEQRRHFRERFGQAEGDFLRLKGYGLANIGPLGQGALDRFAAKLAKALYYKHTGMVLDGELWAYNFSATPGKTSATVLEKMLSITANASITVRAGRSLQDQFTYRYNVGAGPASLFYAVVQFNDQMLFHIVACSHLFRSSVGGNMGVLDEEPLASMWVNARIRAGS